jgi:hypothetical protein
MTGKCFGSAACLRRNPLRDLINFLIARLGEILSNEKHQIDTRSERPNADIFVMC